MRSISLPKKYQRSPALRGEAVRLSKNFSVEDLSVTETKLPNTPGPEESRSLLFLALFLLDPIVAKFGKTAIASAFRRPLVNRKVGGSDSSQHLAGEAGDIIPLESDIKDVFHWCRKNLTFGQLIFETKGGKQWIHISLPRLGKQNNEVLVFDGEIYMAYKEGMV